MRCRLLRCRRLPQPHANRLRDPSRVLTVQMGGDAHTGVTTVELHTAIGDKDSAFRALAASCNLPEAFAPAIRVWKGFRPLHGDPRYEALLHRMNLPLPASG